MSGQRHTTEAECPSCGCDEAVVRVRGNAFSAVCTCCGRADVAPLLTEADLLDVAGEPYEAQLYELDAVRYGDPSPLQSLAAAEARVADLNSQIAALGERVEQTLPPYLREGTPGRDALRVELRLPVPPR